MIKFILKYLKLKYFEPSLCMLIVAIMTIIGYLSGSTTANRDSCREYVHDARTRLICKAYPHLDECSKEMTKP